jgi:hypothetical protein
MTQSNQATTNDTDDLITIARSQLGVAFAPLSGPLTQISTTTKREYSCKLKGGFGAFALMSGSATVMSGAIAVVLPGTKVRANSGSVVIAYRDAEVIAHKRAVVLRVTPSVKEWPQK